MLHADMSAYNDPDIINDLKLEPLRSAKSQVSQAKYMRLSVPLDETPSASAPLDVPVCASK